MLSHFKTSSYFTTWTEISTVSDPSFRFPTKLKNAVSVYLLSTYHSLHWNDQDHSSSVYNELYQLAIFLNLYLVLQVCQIGYFSEIRQEVYNAEIRYMKSLSLILLQVIAVHATLFVICFFMLTFAPLEGSHNSLNCYTLFQFCHFCPNIFTCAVFAVHCL